MLEDFIAGRGAGDYAAYRVRGLADWEQSDSPMSCNALLVAYRRPLDPFRLPGGDAYYGCRDGRSRRSRGGPTRLSELAESSAEVKAAFLSQWKAHPLCAYVVERQDCCEVIKDTAT